MPQWLKCRFCDWKCRAYYTRKDGKKRNAYWMLKEHVALSHPKEYDKIDAYIDKDKQTEISHDNP